MARPNDQTVVLFNYFNEIGIIAQLANNLFEARLPAGLTRSQFSVLNWFLRVDDIATPTRLARAFQVTGGAMTNTLKKLESKGLITITPDSKSGRQKQVSITDTGRQMRDEAIASVQPLLAEFARSLDAQEIASQTALLARVRAYLDEYRFR
jgi:DNA-binding MarR family transcriptional regulator